VEGESATSRNASSIPRLVNNSCTVRVVNEALMFALIDYANLNPPQPPTS
jgi:hypothetical protein